MNLLDATRIVVLLTVVALGTPVIAQSRTVQLKYKAAPVDNPLKGFVPYAGQGGEFPYSMEFDYVPLRSVMTGPDEFDWRPIDRLLDDIAGRGRQAVIRVYQEYPGEPIAIPKFLVDDGVSVRRWKSVITGGIDHTPDYTDARVERALLTFIAAFGQRYDDDPRLAYVTAGLLGTWGEWHCHPHEDWFASKSLQEKVMDAYAKAFEKTPILVRYPAGPKDSEYAPNHDRTFGYHDDSFGGATLDTGRNGDQWFFMSRMSRAGELAKAKWRTRPIGGEIQPELWPCLWSENGCKDQQDFSRCLDRTHATWLMESSTNRRLTKPQRDRAIAAARRLGYEFHVSSCTVEHSEDGGSITCRVEVENRGVAPFYRDWPLELRLVGEKRAPSTTKTDWKLTGVLPGKSREWQGVVEIEGLPEGEYTLVARAVNPLANGRDLAFANVTWNSPLKGWLGLATVTIPVDVRAN